MSTAWSESVDYHLWFTDWVGQFGPIVFLDDGVNFSQDLYVGGAIDVDKRNSGDPDTITWAILRLDENYQMIKGWQLDGTNYQSGDDQYGYIDFMEYDVSTEMMYGTTKSYKTSTPGLRDHFFRIGFLPSSPKDLDLTSLKVRRQQGLNDDIETVGMMAKDGKIHLSVKVRG